MIERNKYPTCITDKNLNPLWPEGYTTKYFTSGCKLHWVYNYFNSENIWNKQEDSEKESYLSIENIVLMSQQKQKDNPHAFLGETLGSATLYNGASKTICGTKWYKCFLEPIPKKQRQKIKVQDEVRADKFGYGNKLTLLYTATLLWIIIGNEIISDVRDLEIALLISKNNMKKARTFNTTVSPYWGEKFQ